MACTTTRKAYQPDYWLETRRPLVCLVFLLPLLIGYEAGVVMFGGYRADAIRNGADYWMRGWLAAAGFGYGLLLPALVVAGLLVWQLVGKHPWGVSPETLGGMAAESLLFAFLLVVVGQLTDRLLGPWGTGSPASLSRAQAAMAVTYLGAGVYEEFLFRLCLLPACYGLLRGLQLDPKWSTAIAILASSLVFSLAHYVGPTGDRLVVFTFLFRTLAGVFFGALFVVRGFGITVGCHAVYDLLVGIVLKA